jgi:exodeoxyribonuclease VII large subunit
LAPLREKQQKLDDIKLRLERGIKISIDMVKNRIGSNKKHLFLLNPLPKIKLQRTLLLENKKKMTNQMKLALSLFRNSLQATMKRLNSVSPLSVLERGFSICRAHPAGKIIKNSRKVSKGEVVKVQLCKGKLLCTVDDKENE